MKVSKPMWLVCICVRLNMIKYCIINFSAKDRVHTVLSVPTTIFNKLYCCRLSTREDYSDTHLNQQKVFLQPLSHYTRCLEYLCNHYPQSSQAQCYILAFHTSGHKYSQPEAEPKESREKGQYIQRLSHSYEI